jgi:hypothetical protein
MKQFYLLLIIFIIPFFCHGQKHSHSNIQRDSAIIFQGPPEYEASFPGGQDSLYKFIYKNLNFPDSIKNTDIKGKVFVDLEIDYSGKITQIRILKGLTQSIDDEIVRVVRLMPDWIPATIRKTRIESTHSLIIPIVMGSLKKKQENL